MRNHYVSPRPGVPGAIEAGLANARWLRRLRRFVASRLPFPALASDVRDILYANWVVPVARIAALIPQGVTLAERDGAVILTVLTYRHGHFGPAFLGPLRGLFPSPLQSNWRFYIADGCGEGRTGARQVLFFHNLFDSALYAAGARVFSDALPSHCAARFVHEVAGEQMSIAIEGPDKVPMLDLTVSTGEAERSLPATLRSFFTSWEEAIASLCQQEGAIAAVADEGRLAHARISLPIDLASVKPVRFLSGSAGPWLEQLGVSGPPFCFAVPAVHFRVLSDRLLPP